MAREIKSEIIINETTDKVWTELMDFKSYDEWNPFIKSISHDSENNELTKGQQLSVHLHLVNQKNPMKFKPKIKSLIPNQEFSWLGHLYLPYLFDGRHIFELQVLGNNKTKFIQREQFTGILAFIVKFIKKDTQDSFDLMNKSLKSRVESVST